MIQLNSNTSTSNITILLHDILFKVFDNKVNNCLSEIDKIVLQTYWAAENELFKT